MRRPPHRIDRARILLGVLLGLALDAPHAVSADEAEAIPLTELTLEELMDVKVTLPSRRPESRSLAAATVFVITQEDIRRSG